MANTNFDERFIGGAAPANTNEQSFFQGLDRLNSGMQQLAISKAMSDAQQHVNNIQDTLTDENDRYIATRQVANNLALAMGQAGANPADINTAAAHFSTQPTQFEAAMRESAQGAQQSQALESMREANENAMLDKKLEAEKEMAGLKQKVPAALLNKLEPLQTATEAGDEIIKLAQEDPEFFKKSVGIQNAGGLGALKASGILNTLGITSDSDQERFTDMYNRLQRGVTTMESSTGGARAVSNAAIQNRFQQIAGGPTDNAEALLTRVIGNRNAAAEQEATHIRDAVAGGYVKAGNISAHPKEMRSAHAILNPGAVPSAASNGMAPSMPAGFKF